MRFASGVRLEFTSVSLYVDRTSPTWVYYVQDASVLFTPDCFMKQLRLHRPHSCSWLSSPLAHQFLYQRLKFYIGFPLISLFYVFLISTWHIFQWSVLPPPHSLLPSHPYSIIAFVQPPTLKVCEWEQQDCLVEIVKKFAYLHYINA